MFDLKTYGYTDPGSFQLREYGDDALPGRVIDCRRGLYKVISGHGEIWAEIKGSFYHTMGEGDFPVAGDFVAFRYNPAGNSLICGLLPRRTRFSRADFSGRSEGYTNNVREQVVAANFDYVFIVTSLNQDFSANRIARYLTAAWRSGGFPVAVLSKADLCDNAEERAAEIRPLARDAPVIPVSSKTGAGLDSLAPFLEPSKTIVLLGSSGTGKSSLLNALSGASIAKVEAIREGDDKGRHTTTNRQLFMLPGGAMVIDTPGMRELGLFDSAEGVSLAFTEIEELFSQCRFSNCSHRTEPGCAVRAALEDGRIPEESWRRYLAQKRETAYVEDHSAYLREKREFHKSITKMNRAKRRP